MGLPSEAVVVAGGGLSGLTAAAALGAARMPVLVFGDADEVGACQIYERGAAVTALRRIGVPIVGSRQGPNGGFAIWRGARHTLPVGCCSLLTTGLFGPAAKLELARFLASIPALDVSSLHTVATDEWLRTRLRDPRVLEFALALVRFTSCTNDPERYSAAAAADRLKLSLSGPTLSLHGGWGTLVAALRAAAASRGVTIATGRRVFGLEVDRGQVVSVALGDGSAVGCRAVIIAGGPTDAGALLGTVPAPSAFPVCVATLDLALRQLPSKRACFALGVDDPVSCSTEGDARGPSGLAFVHAAKYLASGESGSPAGETALERVVDLLQPGWRDVIVDRRFHPRVVVSSALVTASSGGAPCRPETRVPALDNVFLAGDWIGPIGQLADASVASGLRAARAVERLIASS